MKILHLLPEENVGGAGVLLESVLRHYDRSAFQMEVALPRNARLRARYAAQGSVLWDLPSAHRIDAFCRLIRACAPDAVHTHACPQGQIAAWLCGLPCVATRHCVESRTPWLHRALRQLPFFFATHWIAVGAAVRQALLQEGVVQRKITVVPNGAETPKANEKTVQDRFALAADTKVVAFLGRMERIKGADLFVEAMLSLCQRHKDVICIAVGDGSLLSALRTRVAQAGMQQRILLPGFLQDGGAVLRGAALFCNTSRSEAHSIAVTEALARGVPCLCTDVSGNREILRYGGGVTVPLSTGSEGLCAAASWLLEREKIRTWLSQEAKEAFLARFSVKNAVKAWENVYYDLISSYKTKKETNYT